MRLTLVQVLINSKGYNMNPMQSLYYVSPACFVCLLFPFGERRGRQRVLPVRMCGAAGAGEAWCCALCAGGGLVDAAEAGL
jgi:hypothetical protein